MLILSLSSCTNTKTNQSENPKPDNTDTSQSLSPTVNSDENYPAPIVTKVFSTPGYPAATINTIPTVANALETDNLISTNNVNQLKLLDTLNVNEMVRVIWSNDQKSISIIAYDHFTVYSFPLLEKLWKTLSPAYSDTLSP